MILRLIIVKQEYHNYRDYSSILYLLKTDYRCIKLFSNLCKNGKTYFVKCNYHDIAPYDYW